MDTSPPRNDFVHVGGVRLHFLDWGGTGPAMLLLTGIGDSAHIFDSFAPKFTDSFHVLGLTRRGHPGSDTPESGYDAATLAEDIAGFLTEMGIDRSILVGHSLAGGEMTRFGAAYPQRTVALVYLDAAYDRTDVPALLAQDPCAKISPPQAEAEIHASADAYLAHILRISPRYKEVWSDLLDQEFRRQIAVRADGTATDLMPPEVNAALWQGMSSYVYEFGGIEAPVLAFYAVGNIPGFPEYWSYDQKCKFADFVQRSCVPWQLRSIDAMRRALPSSRIIQLPGANHYVFLQNEDLVVSEMRRFLLPIVELDRSAA